MHFITLILGAAILGLASANPVTQPQSTDVTSSIPNPTTSPPPKKQLSICCCCMHEPQPIVDYYIAVCPREGVRAVCGDGPVGDSEYSLGGLEGQPERIANECSEVRCGPVEFVD